MPPAKRTHPIENTRILQGRQSAETVKRADTSSSGSNIDGGAIAGIIIGSILGFLLLLWILSRTRSHCAPPQERRRPVWHEHDAGARRSRSRHRRRKFRGPHHVQGVHPRRSSREVRMAVQPVYVEPRRPSRTYVAHNDGRRGRSSSSRRRYYVS